MQHNPTPAKTADLPDHERAFEWPRQAMRERNWLEAAWRWSVLQQTYPNQPAPFFQAITALIEANKLDQAQNVLNQAKQVFPNHPHVLLDAATLAMQQQDWGEAETLLTQAQQKHPDYFQTWIKSSNNAEAMGDITKATKYCQKACQTNPDIPAPFIQNAELAMRHKQWELALERWEIVRSKFPKIQAGYSRAAEAARKLNRNKEARQLLLAQQYGPDIINEQHESHPNPVLHKGKPGFRSLLELIWTKARFNLQSEVHRNYLSYGWWILEPLLHMVIYYIVFGMLLNRGGDNYPVFLLTGLIPWMWFMKCISGSSNSIITEQNLMLQVSLPTIIFPLITLLQTTIKQLPVFLLLISFVWLQGHAPAGHWLGLLPIIIVQAILIITFSCIVAAVIPFIRDLSYLVPTGLTFLMFLSGIFYDYRMISEKWQDIFLLNPIAFLLKSYREVFIDGILPDITVLMYWGLGGIITSLLIILLYNRLRYTYPRIVME